LKGQLADENGEEHVTTMESMDFTAISKVILLHEKIIIKSF